MAERLGAGIGLRGIKSTLPVLMQEATPTAALATAHRPEIALWNRQNLQQLYDFQHRTDEGCFFVSLYAMSAALYPDRPLPAAEDFLRSIRPSYAHVLEPDRLLVPNEKLALALDLYKDWDMQVVRLTRNRKAEDILCNSLSAYQQKGMVQDTGSYDYLDISCFQAPFAVWMHEGVSNQAHFVTVDGSYEAANMLQDYQHNKKYFIKMVMEAAPREEREVGKGM